ncbi:glycine betaine transport ATP-binding protein [Bacteroides sp. CAG:443]|jgi:glycine betaine/proline transport system ATP-binding protein|nr:glycine betaine transport ATP-binding protein [Bacteroides sp. CAG:443]
MNEKKKIEIIKLYLIFGRERNKAFKMLMKGKSKWEIKKETGCIIAVNGANFAINEGEIFVIMGLSGSGKSSLLRCINRLDKPILGAIVVNGSNIVTMTDEELRTVRRKKLAMVFQQFGLLPHRTVWQNIAFGLELQGVRKKVREQKALESMRTVGLVGCENKMINELSEAMKQRVGLARALANNPEILLMDEAFSALDSLSRIQMQNELLALQSEKKKTIVFVTHDWEEAIRLGDRIAIMRDGEILQIGTSEEILTKPANDYVRNFVKSRVTKAKGITSVID